MTTPSPRSRRRPIAIALTALLSLGLLLIAGMPASAASYVRISGEGSSWAGLAWAQFAANAQRQGVTVDYTPNGSSLGRGDFARQTNASFADSEIPFTGDASDPQDTTTPPFAYAQLPVVAGGTAFMYNLPIGGAQYQGLNLDMPTIARIFAGEITMWDDPALSALNPGVAMPHQTITVVARSDGSGATAQFKLWMLRQYPSDYTFLAQHTGGDPNHASSYFPTGDLANFKSQNGSTGSSQFVANTAYSINYDEYAYASAFHLPVASVKNAAGYFTQPTAQAVAVALIAAKINTDTSSPNYLSQDLSNVYTYADPRAYPMSMYSYEIVPHVTNAVTDGSRGATLSWVTTQALCEWQRDMSSLGYSPLPMNLVLAGFDEVLGIPGIDAATKASIASAQNGVLNAGTNPCNNPTFQPGDDPSHNLLVDTAPFPKACNAACQGPWKQAGKGVGGGPSFSGKATGTTGKTSSTTGTGNATQGGGKQTCDSDTGVCTGGNAVAGASNIKNAPTTIDDSRAGWTTNQTIGLVVGSLMVIALIVGPAVVTTLTRRSRRGGTT